MHDVDDVDVLDEMLGAMWCTDVHEHSLLGMWCAVCNQADSVRC
jgi:hypothetical protein